MDFAGISFWGLDTSISTSYIQLSFAIQKLGHKSLPAGYKLGQMQSAPILLFYLIKDIYGRITF